MPDKSEQRLVYEVPEAGAMLGLSRNARALAHRTELPGIERSRCRGVRGEVA